MSLIDELRQLVTTPGVSGFEYKIRDLICKKLERLQVRYKIDALGNVIVEFGQGSDIILLTAHMDEVGLLVTYIEPDGKIRFRKVGGIDDRVLPGQHVLIYDENVEIEGVIGLLPPHLQLRRDLQVVPWYELHIDVGVESREEVEQLGVRPLMPVVLDKKFTVLARGRYVSGRGIDDRVGCLALLKLAEQLSRESAELKDRKIVLAWCVQEEIGLRGAKALTNIMKPKVAIIVDTISCCNPVITGNLKLGQGLAVRLVDAEFIGSLRLSQEVVKIAQEEKIPVQVTSAGGTTDALEVQELNVHTISVGIATKYTHSSVELCSVEDIKWLIDLLYKVATRLDLTKFSY